MPQNMALLPSESSAKARNILGRPAQRQYSLMQQSSILSQPPLRASGKHAQRQAPTTIATDPDTLQCASPTTVPVQSPPSHEVHPVQENAVSDTSDDARNFLPSPAPSDHYNKSPSLATAHQPLSEPAVRQSQRQPAFWRDPAQPCTRVTENRHVSATSSVRQPSRSVSALPPLASSTPATHAQPPPPGSNNASPFGPQWSTVFQSAECTKRLSDFAAAHGNLTDADLERLGILYDATIQNDWYFIILLMLLACHSLNLPSLQSVQAHLPKDSLPMLAKILGEQWEGGGSLSNEVKIFISTFPKPLDELRVCLIGSSFMLAIRHIASCLHQITLNLDRVLSQCRQAETLPTTHDLIVSLGIRSLLLQRATFRFLLRNTWDSDSGPMAELAMREFMIEQQRFGMEGAQSPELRGHQQNIYRTIFHQHLRSTHFPHSSQTPNPANTILHTSSTMQQPTQAPTAPCTFDIGMTQPQSPHTGQTNIQPSYQAQAPIPTGADFHAFQMEAQRREVRMRAMRAQAHAQSAAQAQSQAAQPPFPAHFQNYLQGASLPASAFFQTPGGIFPAQFQQGPSALPHQSVRQNNTAPHDAAQMQALMMYQQEMLPQQPILPSTSISAPSLASQMSCPQQARSTPPPRLFFPGPNPAVPQPAHPDYRRSALHQAHLRSPVLVPRTPDNPASAASNDIYRRVAGFALPPHRLTTEPVQVIPFQLPPQAISRLLKVKLSPDGNPPVGEIDTKSLMLRLRCCEVVPFQPVPTENKWVLLDGSWPLQAYFAINETPLEPRRKLHHGKFLPIDITHCISSETNKLVVRINRSKHDKSPFNYAVAVEVVDFVSRNDIKEACKKHLIPPEQILDSIKKSLVSRDDDLIVQSNFTLQLYEPFSNAKIFDIPVRSKDCLHKQAFDLDVFLETRLDKNRISKVDAWKCPICKADSRPQSLIVDGFLMAVRDTLAARDMLKTRAINVEGDGSWTPVQEVHDDEETDDEPASAPRRPIEVVLIDD